MLSKQEQTNQERPAKENMVAKSFASQHDDAKRLFELKNRIEINSK
jgi:hypothetical protein